MNSEHEKNLNDQFRRMWEMMRTQASNDNPLSHFFTGNSETLADRPKKNSIPSQLACFDTATQESDSRSGESSCGGL